MGTYVYLMFLLRYDEYEAGIRDLWKMQLVDQTSQNILICLYLADKVAG